MLIQERFRHNLVPKGRERFCTTYVPHITRVHYTRNEFGYDRSLWKVTYLKAQVRSLQIENHRWQIMSQKRYTFRTNVCSPIMIAQTFGHLAWKTRVRSRNHRGTIRRDFRGTSYLGIDELCGPTLQVLVTKGQ